MNLLKRFTLLNLILFLIIFQFPHKDSYAITDTRQINPIKVGVLLYSFDDLFLSQLKKDLENIQNENPNKINFTFYDGKANPAIQFQIADTIIQDGYDLLILNMVEKRRTEFEDIILKIKTKNIPVIFYISSTLGTDMLKTYPKGILMMPELKGPGIAEGELVSDTWKNNKEMDKNKDRTLQYIMLQGRPDSEQTIERTKYSIETIENSGIKTQQLTSVIGNWNQDLAKSLISSLFLQYGNKIEAIISNNDAMAIGAIEAIQQYGYNKGDKSKFIPVFGIDALPKAKELIKQGVMTGSIFQDSRFIAEALYKVSLNLVANESPIKDTNYLLNGYVITLPLNYEKYTIDSN